MLYIIFCVDLSDLVKNCSKGNMVGIFMKMKFENLEINNYMYLCKSFFLLRRFS